MSYLVYYEPTAGDWLECDHGSMCCWQHWDGVEPLEAVRGKNDEHDRHALTRLSRPPKPPVEVREVPWAVERLARLLFETDESVLTHVRIRSESTQRDHESTRAHIRAYLDVGPRDELGPKRWSKVMQIAWDLNVAGLRTKATDRATRMRQLSESNGVANSPSVSKGSEGSEQ